VLRHQRDGEFPFQMKKPTKESENKKLRAPCEIGKNKSRIGATT
jgi:hypothetical protein